MGKSSVCSADGCDSKAVRYGDGTRCASDYKRWRGALVCSVSGCDAKVHTVASALCVKHYTRMRAHGDPLKVIREVSAPYAGSCSIEGCDGPAKKRGWCGKHYRRWSRHGSADVARWEWADSRVCVVCERPTGAVEGLRRYCSWSCARIYSANGGVVKVVVDCMRCGAQIDRRPDGQRGWIRDDVAMCKACRHARVKGYGASATELAVRDGTNCSLCGESVDMALTRADGTMCASVDHVMPYSLGGSDDAANLALAHLKCNQLKSNTIGWLAPA